MALACFPTLTHAAAEIPEYEPEIPTTTGHKHPPTHSNNPVGGNQSHTGGNGGATASNSGGQGGSSGAGSSSKGSSSGGAIAEASHNPGTGNGGGKGQGSQGKSGTNGQTQAQPVSNASKDDGGSSPLVPILIAVAALAAISIGAVVIRQRRQRAGSPISPKAS